MQIDPNRAATLRSYSLVLSSLAHGEQAIAAARKSAELDPLSDESWTQLGRALGGMHRDAEASQALERALVLNPQQNWANFLLGNLLLSQGKVDEAMAHYQRAPEQFRKHYTGLPIPEIVRL